MRIRVLMALLVTAVLSTYGYPAAAVEGSITPIGFCGKVFTMVPFCYEPDCYLLDECIDDAGGGWEWEQPCLLCLSDLLDSGIIKHCLNERGWCKFPFDAEEPDPQP